MQELLGLTLRLSSPQGFIYLVAKRMSFLGTYLRTDTVTHTFDCDKDHKTRAEKKRHGLGQCGQISWDRERAVWRGQNGQESWEIYNQFVESSPAHWSWYDPEPGAELWLIDRYVAAVTSLEMLVGDQWEHPLTDRQESAI